MGVFASLIALGGLLLSIAAGNTESIGFGVIDRDTQAALAWVAGAVLVLVFIKIGIRCRRLVAPDCTFNARTIGGSRRR
jgi:hypothetical protein